MFILTFYFNFCKFVLCFFYRGSCCFPASRRIGWFWFALPRVKAKQIDYGIDPSRIIKEHKVSETWTDLKLWMLTCSTVVHVTIQLAL